MDIKEIINELIEKIKKDPSLAEKFIKNPVATVEGLLGVDLPDEQIGKIVDGIKASGSMDKIVDGIKAAGSVDKIVDGIKAAGSVDKLAGVLGNMLGKK